MGWGIYAWRLGLDHMTAKASVQIPTINDDLLKSFIFRSNDSLKNL